MGVGPPAGFALVDDAELPVSSRSQGVEPLQPRERLLLTFVEASRT